MAKAEPKVTIERLARTEIVKDRGEKRVATQCEQCGQTDDHPKVHVGNATKHYDCLAVTEEKLVRGSLVADGALHPADIIDAAKDGTHGPDLLAFIQTPQTQKE